MMREWRTPEQERDDRRDAGTLTVEAWLLGAGMFFMALAYLFHGLPL
jgi:hypothetical protein